MHTFKDTYSFLAVTLDTSRRLLATVWTQTSLPFNSTTLLPVPKPLGGTTSTIHHEVPCHMDCCQLGVSECIVVRWLTHHTTLQDGVL